MKECIKCACDFYEGNSVGHLDPHTGTRWEEARNRWLADGWLEQDFEEKGMMYRLHGEGSDRNETNLDC